MSKAISARTTVDNTQTLDGKQKLVLFIMLVMVVLMLIPSVFSGDNFIVTLLNKIGLTAIVALTVALLCFLRYDGEPLIDYHLMFSKSIRWEVIFLLASALVLSGALTSSDTGIQTFLREIFNPILAGHGKLAFTIIALGIAIVATNFANNMVVMLILMPIMATFSATVGANMHTFAVSLVYMTGMALLTPAASPFAAVLHGNNWVKKKDIFRIVLLLMLSIYLIVVCIMVPFSDNILFRQQ